MWTQYSSTGSTVVRQCANFAFGEANGACTGSVVPDDSNFQDMFQDGDGTYHTWACHYSTAQDRWLSFDPAVSGKNLYGFVGGDPVNAVDPLGLYCVWDDGSEHDPDPSEGGIDEEGCKAASGHWDPYDTVDKGGWPTQAGFA